MAQWIEWKNRATEALKRGLSGEYPPINSTGMAWVLMLVRDVLLSAIELVLTAAGVFTYIMVTSAFFKMLLIIAIIVSCFRIYITALRFGASWLVVAIPFCHRSG